MCGDIAADTETYKRLDESQKRQLDTDTKNALQGYIHHFGCDMVLCPLCGDQLLSCGCFDECMGRLYDDDDDDT